MTIVSLPFVAIAVAGTVLVRVHWLKQWRAQVLAGLGLAFAASASGSVGDAFCLAAMTATGWVFIRLVARNKSAALLATGIGCIVVEFLIARQVLPHVPAPGWLKVGWTVGLSYIMFRVIHLIIDVHGDEFGPELTVPRYIAFLFCYLTFLAGPIQRMEDFLAGVQRQNNTRVMKDIETFLPGIATGYVKYTLIAAGCYAIQGWSQSAATGLRPALADAIGMLGFAAYLYASFSGYTDVVRGLAGMIGLPLPANFDRPWAAPNFLDFWSRWHISLSEWFKIYVFSPLVKGMIAAADRPRWVPALGAAGYFVTFALMGLWHGISWRYVLYGICLGAGVSVNKLYQNTLLRRLGRPGVAVLARAPLYTAGARALALTFFVVMLGFLWVPAESIGVENWGGWAAGALLTGVLIFALVLASSALGPRLGAARRASTVPVVPPSVLIGFQAAMVLVYVVVLGMPVPPLLYQFF